MVRIAGLAVAWSILASQAFAGQVSIPEPASLAVLATGVGALFLYRMRKRK